MSRIWRYGQTAPCFVYRLLHRATLEERVYDKTLVKEELFARVGRCSRFVVVVVCLQPSLWLCVYVEVRVRCRTLNELDPDPQT